MDQRPGETARRVLAALADLSPAAEQRSSSLTIPTEWFRWLPAQAARLFLPTALFSEYAAQRRSEQRLASAGLDRKFAERLAAIDQIRPTQRSLRVGWLFVAGQAPAGEGRSHRVFHPLVTVPVRIERMTSYLVPAGDVQVSELITDRRLRRELESNIELGGGALDSITDIGIPANLLSRLPRLQAFARSAAAGAQLPARQLVPANAGPDALMRAEGLVIVAAPASTRCTRPAAPAGPGRYGPGPPRASTSCPPSTGSMWTTGRNRRRRPTTNLRTRSSRPTFSPPCSEKRSRAAAIDR